MNHLALDIGGANIKMADGRGMSRSLPFALWRHPARLAETLAELLREVPDATRLWAILQQAGGGIWGGCVYDVDAIEELISAGRAALGK